MARAVSISARWAPSSNDDGEKLIVKIYPRLTRCRRSRIIPRPRHQRFAAAWDLPGVVGCDCNIRLFTVQPRRASMRKLLLAIALIVGFGLVVQAIVTPTTAQPVDCSKK